MPSIIKSKNGSTKANSTIAAPRRDWRPAVIEPFRPTQWNNIIHPSDNRPDSQPRLFYSCDSVNCLVILLSGITEVFPSLSTQYAELVPVAAKVGSQETLEAGTDTVTVIVSLEFAVSTSVVMPLTWIVVV